MQPFYSSFYAQSLMVAGPATSVLSLATCVLLGLNIFVERKQLVDLITGPAVGASTSTSTSSTAPWARGGRALPGEREGRSASSSSSTTSSSSPPARPTSPRLRSTRRPPADFELFAEPSSYSWLASAALCGGWLLSALLGGAAGAVWASRRSRPDEVAVVATPSRVRGSKAEVLAGPPRGVVTPSSRRKLVQDGAKL